VHPLIVIPARLGSVRLPGKPLCKIDGEPLVCLVVRNVLEFGLDAKVVVATDDESVEKAVSGLGVQSITTSRTHRSGTERVAEVALQPEFAEFEQILNVQGDQPFLPENAAIGALKQLESGFPIGTAAAPLQDHQESNRNRVKVGVDREGRALSFSRGMPKPAESDGLIGVFLHLGLYAYTRAALLDWIALPNTAVEVDEGLEQLRPFLHGTPIGVALLNNSVEPGVDTLEDLERALKSIASTRTNA
jgi:3-deoxy-manno-octulosonate cytidylyltransferase (CMP-KDO synthetase)